MLVVGLDGAREGSTRGHIPCMFGVSKSFSNELCSTSCLAVSTSARPAADVVMHTQSSNVFVETCWRACAPELRALAHLA